MVTFVLIFCATSIFLIGFLLGVVTRNPPPRATLYDWDRDQYGLLTEDEWQKWRK